LVHPFPSALNAAAAAAIALIVGARPDVALRLSLGMLFCQFSIGAANDIADRLADAVAKPWKPIPAGFVPLDVAASSCAVAAAAGLTLAWTVSPGALAVAVVGLLDGLVYDFKLKATALAWLPFAAGVGLVPLYAWLGVRDGIPGAVLAVVALSVLAGATLALANAYADLQLDMRTGVRTVAVLLGPEITLALNGATLLATQAIACLTLLAARPQVSDVALAVVGCGLGWLGVGLGRVAADRWRHLVWEVQGIGIAALGIALLDTLVRAGALKG